MAGLESFDMAYQRHRPSRSISEHPLQPQHNILSTDIIREQQRNTLLEISRKKGNFSILYKQSSYFGKYNTILIRYNDQFYFTFQINLLMIL